MHWKWQRKGIIQECLVLADEEVVKQGVNWYWQRRRSEKGLFGTDNGGFLRKEGIGTGTSAGDKAEGLLKW